LSLVAIRVDDRLIHGQVLLAWGPALSPDRYAVVDDALAADPFQAMLLSSTTGGLPVDVLAEKDVATRLVPLAEGPEATFVLVRGLPEAARLAALLDRAGHRPAAINLGGLHYAPGKERVHDSVYLDPADRTALADLAGRGVRVVVQEVPAIRPMDAPEAWRESA
jgi:PTS system mannose-specific IIB component